MNTTSSPCVFVADDDEDDRYLLAIAFEQNSPQCRLLFAQDGMDLLEALGQANELPCLILLDLNMPRLNGFEALQHLREHPLYQDVPVVILTTSDLVDDQHRAQELGANGFITKPLNANLLGEVVLKLRADWLIGKCI